MNSEDAAAPAVRASALPTRVVACTSNAIAVVEDDVVLRDVICAVLRDVGLVPHTASTLPNARKLIGVVHPCAVVLDLHLGQEDASSLLDEMAGEGVRVPVVVMSADVQRLRARPLMRCAAMVEKPFELDRLVDAILAAVVA